MSASAPSLPSASIDASAASSPLATNGASPTPAAHKTPDPAGGALPYPVKGSADPPLMVAGPDGGVYAAVTDGDSIVVGLFARDGSVRPGWPVHLKTQWCTQLVAAADGSVRAACAPWRSGSEAEGGLEAPVMQIFAIDSRGRSLHGWPVDVEGGSTIGAMGDELGVVVRPYVGDTVEEGDNEPALLAMVGSDGHVRSGQAEVAVPCCESSTAIGPTMAYAVTRRGYVGDRQSDMTAFGLNGVTWTVTMDGIASDPAFDARGNAYVSLWLGDPNPSRTVVFDPGRAPPPDGTDDLPIQPIERPERGRIQYPAAPTVATDGSSFLVEEDGGTSILAIDRAGNPRRGWPYRTAQGIGYQGECGQAETGCDLPSVRPAVGPDGTLYVALDAALCLGP